MRAAFALGRPCGPLAGLGLKPAPPGGGEALEGAGALTDPHLHTLLVRALPHNNAIIMS